MTDRKCPPAPQQMWNEAIIRVLVDDDEFERDAVLFVQRAKKPFDFL
ncbi:MAG: hypothetical protein MUD06_00905 [Rhodospirillales bacterium]|jgi:hypothetical protein|nr:hypothetical protein [Rhodospirillales bacterium]